MRSLVAIALICMIAVAFCEGQAQQSHGGKSPKSPQQKQHKQSHHKRKAFAQDFCAQQHYAQCKEALAPYMGSLAEILNAGEAIKQCLTIKDCPIMKTQNFAMYNPYFLGDNVAEDLELAGEWLLIDSQCEQDLGAELFLASNLIADYKQVENDIMDVIFIVMFGEQGYKQCSPLFMPPF